MFEQEAIEPGKLDSVATKIANRLNSWSQREIERVSHIYVVVPGEVRGTGDAAMRILQVIRPKLGRRMGRTPPKIEIVRPTFEFPVWLSARRLSEGVYALCEYEVSVVDGDCVGVISRETKLELLDIVDRLLADAKAVPLADAIRNLADLGLVAPIMSPAANALGLLEARSRRFEEARLFFAPVSPSMVLLGAVSKARGGGHAQDLAIQNAIRRFRRVPDMARLLSPPQV